MVLPPRFTAPESFYSRAKLTKLHKKGRATLLMPLAMFLISVLTMETADAQYVSDQITGNRTCACGVYNPDEDYFAETGKAAPNFARKWNVTYHKSYKRIVVPLVGSSTDVDKSMVIYAYLCGTPEPISQMLVDNSSYAIVESVEIPLRFVGLGSATYIPYMEYIDQRRSVKYIGTDGRTVSSCMKKLFENNEVRDDTVFGLSGADILGFSSEKSDAYFFGISSVNSFRTRRNLVLNYSSMATIPVAETAEITPEAIAEWVEYFALFYNREKAANVVAENILLRMNCSSQIAESQPTKPKVLFTSFGYGSYDDLVCPHWFCELAKRANVEPLQFPFAGYPWTNDTAFLEFAKDADIWIYNDANFNGTSYYGATSALAAKSSIFSQIKAFQDGKVFDIQKQSYLSFFEARPAEPDVFLRDIINVAHPGAINHVNVFLRNVFTEPAAPFLSNSSSCVNPSVSRFNNWVKGGCAISNPEIIIIPGLGNQGVSFGGCPQGSTTGSPATTESPTSEDLEGNAMNRVTMPIIFFIMLSFVCLLF